MDAKARTVTEILYASNQFIVPFFQRQYSWTRKHWQRLWDDVAGLVEEGGTGQHFMGPMVCTQLPTAPGEVPAYLLIDGQQRMTTLSLFLAALRNVSIEQKDLKLADEVTESFLIHKHKPGLQRYKLLSRITDRDSFISIVDGKGKLDRDSRVAQALNFLQKRIASRVEKEPDALRRLVTTATDRLSLVVITIDGENPFEIFESLNSTGLPLEESDLIRNYIFMQVPQDKQQQFYDEQWGAPLEEKFDESGRAAALTQFYRNYLMRDGYYSKAKSTFVNFKNQNRDRKMTPEQQAQELACYVEYELWLRQPEACPVENIARELAVVRRLDVTTAYPLLMNLLGRYQSGSLNEAALCECIRDLSSFVFRRSICRESTRQYARWFPEAIRSLNNSPRDDLRGYWMRRGWPDDRSFVEALSTFPIYHSERDKARLALEQLESHAGSKEPVVLSKLTIEHIMPQSISGAHAEAWRTMLGSEIERIHKERLHTLGNLTLTGYNYNMSNGCFQDKRTTLIAGNVMLNRYFENVLAWNEDAVVNRSRQLGTTLAAVYPRPLDGAYPANRTIRRRMTADERRAYWQGFLETGPWEDFAHVPCVSARGHLAFRLPGLKDFRLLVYTTKGKNTGVALSCRGIDGTKNCLLLQQHQPALEKAFGQPLTWDVSGGSNFIWANRTVNLFDDADWPSQHHWLRENLLKLQEAFLPHLQQWREDDSEMTDVRREYWTALRQVLVDQKADLRLRQPTSNHWLDFSIGRSYFGIFASLNRREKWVRVALGLYGKHAKEHFQMLQAQKLDIETQLHTQLRWEKLPERKESRIELRLEGVDFMNKSKWAEQHTWMAKQLVAFHETFRERVRELTVDT